MKITMEKIRKHVIENGFGAKPRVRDYWLWSAGIRYAFESAPSLWAPYIAQAYDQVCSGDYGGFYDRDESPIPGYEYYMCPSPFGHDINNSIMMHREHGTLVMYFQFER